MELRQESLFADETKGGIEVIYSKFIDQRRMDYKALFGGFDHLRVITFSYGLGFVETVADMFEDVEIIIGSMNTVRPDIVDRHAPKVGDEAPFQAEATRGTRQGRLRAHLLQHAQDVA